MRDHHLGTVTVGGSAHWYPVGNGVTSDDDATCMDTRVSHIPLELFGQAYGLGYQRVGTVKLSSELRETLEAVLNGDFVLLAGLFLGHVIGAAGNHSGQTVALVNRQALDARHILDGRFRRHGAVGDDVRHLVGAILVGDILQHLGAPVIIKVHIDIRQRDAVGIEETLEKEVILDGVDIGDAQAVGYGRAGRRATARSY